MEKKDSAGVTSKLNNPELFNESIEGDYQYSSNETGKKAVGNLILSEEHERNQKTQREAGGADREDSDDGGHLIGTRFNGSPEAENIDAQNRNLNRGEYKIIENQWASDLKDGKKVYAAVETFKSNGSERPDAYMGYSITEDKEGNRVLDAFSFQNTSVEEQEEWNNTPEECDVDEYDLSTNESIDNTGNNNDILTIEENEEIS